MDLGDDNSNPRIKRARATNWPTVMTKFLLDWYLEKKKGMPPKTKFKKMHHHCCASAVNAKFETTFTVDQVHRHYRRFKEVWNIVSRYMNVTGSRFDKKHMVLVLPSSTMASLPMTERAILAKPIPFFDHLQDLYGDFPVDGASMMDPHTSAELNYDQLEIPDPVNMMTATCQDTRDPDGADLDKIVLESEDNSHEVAASSGPVTCEVLSGTSAESTMAALQPSLTNSKIVSKPKPNPKPQTPAPRDGRNKDVLNNTLTTTHDSIAKPVRTAPTSSDPNVPLWNMLKEIPLTAADRLKVGICLCKPEFEVHRSFFMSMGKEYLKAWSHKFLSGEEPGSL